MSSRQVAGAAAVRLARTTQHGCRRCLLLPFRAYLRYERLSPSAHVSMQSLQQLRAVFSHALHNHAGIGTFQAAPLILQQGLSTCINASGTTATERHVEAAVSSNPAATPAQRQQMHTSTDQQTRWVFLGPPGVGKGTYASRAAKHFGVAHIATGDLIRHEIKAHTNLGRMMKDIVNSGMLVPDNLIFQLLQERLERGQAKGENGFILDGFPRTRLQAEALLELHPIQLALNMDLREEVLVEKCLGRRMCRHCGKNYNIADIHLPAAAGRPEIRMPPLSPPPQCAPHLEVRADDTEEVVRKRLQLYKEQAGPVEEVFRAAGLLREFEITAGIPETLPGLLAELSMYVPKPTVEAQAAYASG